MFSRLEGLPRPFRKRWGRAGEIWVEWALGFASEGFELSVETPTLFRQD